MYDFMTKLAQKAELANPPAPEDYVDPADGLLHCGICRTPKETTIRVPGPWEGRVMRCACRCQTEADEAERKARKAQEIRERIARLRRLGFPDAELARYTFADDDGANARVSGACRKYAEQFETFLESGQGLLLYGPPGTGKSFLAFCIANALIDRGVPCLVSSFSRIVNELEGRQEKQAYLDGLSRFKLLVIDDFAAERATEYMTEQVFQIIDARNRQRLPIIVTTNLTGDELKNAASMSRKRIHSRLLGMCQPVEVTGADRRRQARAAENKTMREMLGLS